ncbi:IS66 family transposase [Bradyrhizobium sp. USDA 3240]
MEVILRELRREKFGAKSEKLRPDPIDLYHETAARTVLESESEDKIWDKADVVAAPAM